MCQGSKGTWHDYGSQRLIIVLHNKPEKGAFSPLFLFEGKMTKRLIRSDSQRRSQTWVHENDDGGWTIEQKQHVGHVLEHNKRLRDEWQKGQLTGNTQKHWQQVAEIPANVFMELKEKFGDYKDNPKAWRKWLNDYDNRFFRTGGGHI